MARGGGGPLGDVTGDASARARVREGGRPSRVPWTTLLACVGLTAFVATTPVFPLTHGMLDYVAPDLTSRAFMGSAGVAAMLLAVALAWRLFGARPLSAPRPATLLVGGATYLVALALGILLYGFLARAGVAMPTSLGVVVGALFGLGSFLGFCGWWLVMPVCGLRGASFAGILRAISVLIATAIGAERVVVPLPVTAATATMLALVAVGALGPAAIALRAAADGEAIPQPITGAALYEALLPSTADEGGDRGGRAGGRRAGGVVDEVLGEEGAPGRAPAFFLGLPLAVFLLYASSFAGVVPTRVDGELPGFAPAALVACLLLVAVSAGRDDARVAAFTLRVFLPLAGVAVLGGSMVMPDASELRAMSLGAQSMCYAYGILMFSFATYAGIQRLGGGMAFVASVTSFVGAVVMLLPYYDVTLGALSAYTPVFVIGVLMVALGFLVSSPSLVLWRGMFTRVTSEPASPEPSLEDTVREACDRAAATYGLTARETEILQYLGRGYGPAYVATVLPIKENTIRSHVRNIYGKMGVRSRGELLEIIDGLAGAPSPSADRSAGETSP